MKRNKQSKEKQRRRRHVVKGGTTRLISPMKVAPEPANKESVPIAAPSNGAGVLRPELDKLHVPGALIEASDTEPSTLMPGRFMLTVMGLAIIFIAIIAWFVSQMPDR